MIIVQYIYYLVSIRFKYHYEFMGWDGLLLLNILHNNQLRVGGYKQQCNGYFASTCNPGVKNFKAGELETNVQVIHSK